MTGKNLSRRELLAAATAASLGAGMTAKAEAVAINDSERDLEARRREAERLRAELAREPLRHPIKDHPTNGDEENLVDANGEPTYIGNYSKGLKHKNFAEPDPQAYLSLWTALQTGEPEDFERIMLGVGIPDTPYVNITFPPCKGAVRYPVDPRSNYRRYSERQVTTSTVGTVKKSQALLVNPQAGLGFDLEGPDSHDLVMRVPPSFSSAEVLGEMAENYWMALARDVPLVEYRAGTTNPILLQAAADLSGFSEFRGPKNADNQVTPDILFRGKSAGDLAGGYVSQFLLRDVPFGAYQFPQRLAFAYKPLVNGGPPPDFLTNEADFLAVQNGSDPAEPPGYDPADRYVAAGRDLANFVHIDELFQAYFMASLILGTPPTRGGLGVPHDGGNPYDGYHYNTVTQTHQRRNSTQQGFGTLGEPNTKGLVTEVGTRALKAVWYQKWVVHRRLRPEEFAGRIHFQMSNKAKYPFHPEEFSKLQPVLDAVKKKNGATWLLPMAFPEGCPIHPAYGAGHATVAGACVTILKAIFHEEITFHDLQACVYTPTHDGKGPATMLMPGQHGYDDLAKQLTVGGELNKLASNISLGRNIAGVHWRSDHEESLKLGEAVGIQLLRETVLTYNERVSFRVTRFDGTQVVLANNK